MGYKKCTLSSDLLSYQFIAFTKKLFTVPKEGDILTVDNSDYSCDLYYQDEYHTKLVLEIRLAYAAGKFAASNNNAGWCKLMDTIANAEDCSLPTQCHDYYTTSKMFLD